MLTRALILFPVLSLAAVAQVPTSSWETVKMLPPGTQIRIASGKSLPILATLESVSDSDLVFGQGAGQQSFPRAEISSISVKRKGHRLRNTLIGLGVGVVAGAAIGFAIGEAQESGCKVSNGCLGLEAAGGLGAGGIIGLVGGTFAGLFWPIGGWQKIYVK